MRKTHNLHFLPWLIRQNRKSVSAATLVWLLYIVASTMIKLDDLKVKPQWVVNHLGWLNILVPLAQAIVIGVVLVAINVRARDLDRSFGAEAATHMSQFFGWWQTAWCLWFVSYLGLAFQQLFEFLTKPGQPDGLGWQVADWVAGSATLAQVAAFYLCFCVLERARYARRPYPFYLGTAFPLLAVAVVATLDVLIRVLTFLRVSAVFAKPDVLSFPVLIAFGVALILLFSRFDGEPMLAPFGILVILYLYGILQPLIALSGRRTFLFVLGIVVALGMKLLAFYVVAWAESSGRLYRYFRNP